MRVDIMVDIECLGIKIDSTIFQISAIAFDINTGKFLNVFNQIADIEQDVVYVDGSTLKWWLNTNKELLSDLLNEGTVSAEELLENFQAWLERLKTSEEVEIYLWGNGILFDNKMIQYQLESNGLEYPIHYKRDRDVRTIVDLASRKLGISESEMKDRIDMSDLVEHNALDDVTYQIRLVKYCYEILTK